MRVVHLVPASFGQNGVVGGAERYALELARHMAEEVPTTLVSFGDKSAETYIGHLRMRVLGGTRYVKGQRFNPIAASMLREIFRADVVHCHQRHIVASQIASLACRVSGRKVFVSDLGGGGWNLAPLFGSEGWFDGHLHISEYSRSVAGQGDDPSAHVIYGGVDTEKFSPSETPQTAGSVLFVGRLLPHKGIDYLIRALPSDMTLEIIGCPYDSGYERDLRKLAEGKDVVFRQYCEDVDLIDAYRRALCVVLPSVYRTMYGNESKVPELLGQTLLEGMACGVPAICTRVASMPEVVLDQTTGFVVPPNDPASLQEKVVWLRDHPVQRQEMGIRARQRVLETFRWDTVVHRCLDIYRN